VQERFPRGVRYDAWEFEGDVDVSATATIGTLNSASSGDAREFRVHAKHADTFDAKTMDWHVWKDAAGARGCDLKNDGQDGKTEYVLNEHICTGDVAQGSYIKSSTSDYSIGCQHGTWTAITRAQYEQESDPYPHVYKGDGGCSESYVVFREKGGKAEYVDIGGGRGALFGNTESSIISLSYYARIPFSQYEQETGPKEPRYQAQDGMMPVVLDTEDGVNAICNACNFTTAVDIANALNAVKA
jgi:hypothetical protein